MDGREKYRRYKQLTLQDPWKSREKIAEQLHGDIHEELSGVVTTEDPWVRYVEITGNDGNDGKTSSTAWRTIGHALEERPIICNMSIIKIGLGTFNERVEVPNGLGSLIIVGTWEEVYDSVIYDSGFSSTGSNSIESWPEMVVDYSGEVGFVLDDTLLDMYIEYNGSTGRRHRVKIIEYAATVAGKARIFFQGEVAAGIAATPNMKFVRPGTIIETASADFVVNIKYHNYGQAQDADKFTQVASGVLLHALTISNTTNTSAAGGITAQRDSAVQFGQVITRSVHASSNAVLLYCNAGSFFVLGTDYYQPETLALLEDRGVTYASGTLTLGGSLRTGGSGLICGLVRDLLHVSDFGSSTLYLGAFGVVQRFKTFYKSGGLIQISNTSKCEVSFYYQATCGSALRISTHGWETTTVEKGASTGKIGFRGTPDATYGRIFLGNDATLICDNSSIDAGVVTGHSAAVPIVSVGSRCILTSTNLTIGGVGATCPGGAPLVKVDNLGKIVTSGTMTLHHSASGNISTVLVDNGGEVLCKSASTCIDARSTSVLTAGSGVVQVEAGGSLHCLGAVSITHTTGVGAGSSLSCLEGNIRIEGAYSSTTTLTGSDILNDDGRIRLDGTITQDTDGSSMRIMGGNASFRTGGALTVTSCATTVPVFQIDSGSRANFGADCKCPTANYGAGSLWKITDGARVKFAVALTDGDGTYNRNSNAGGYGMEIRRDSSVVLATQAGPDGTSGDLYLGKVGTKSYPASGAAVSDVAEGTEASAELCVISTL